ncbi:MAG: hypothetical protein F6K65_37160 [Moorea sp. SIO3C2]|nr:hypothetical protein [Moorena sp. SIO3C2]
MTVISGFIPINHGLRVSQRKKNAIRRRYANARAWPTFQVPCHPLSPIPLINFSTDSDSTQDKSWVELFYDVFSRLASKGVTQKQKE